MGDTSTKRFLILHTRKPLFDSFGSTATHAWVKKFDWHTSIELDSPISLSFETGDDTFAKDLSEDPRIATVLEADAIFKLITPKSRNQIERADIDLQLVPYNGISYPQGITAIGAHNSSFTGKNVKVAILDTGIDSSHPAFIGKNFITKDFTNSGNVNDKDGHGTHCAGTICGSVVNGIRVGVAPGITDLSVAKVIDKDGGTLDMIIRGMLWAVLEQRADIVSMSLGYDLAGNVERYIRQGGDPRIATDEALQLHGKISNGISKLRMFLETQSLNVLFVAATGNESSRPATVLGAAMPAADLFAVGAVVRSKSIDKKWEMADFSNGGALVVVPGVDVISAAPNFKWATMSGTSMATPHVAGVAALYVEKLRKENGINIADAVRSSIIANCSKFLLTNPNPRDVGAGLIQAP